MNLIDFSFPNCSSLQSGGEYIHTIYNLNSVCLVVTILTLTGSINFLQEPAIFFHMSGGFFVLKKIPVKKIKKMF